MNEPDKDPYQHSKPGEVSDGGLSYLTQFGDESGGSGSASIGGTRARKGWTRGTSSKTDEYDTQSRRDIPASDHMFIKGEDDDGDEDGTMMGVGSGVDSTKRQDFTDYRDRLPQDNETFGPDPVGVFNMQTVPGKINRNRKRDSLFERTKRKVKGAYHDKL